jgi:hypothetical protein
MGSTGDELFASISSEVWQPGREGGTSVMSEFALRNPVCVVRLRYNRSVPTRSCRIAKGHFE